MSVNAVWSLAEFANKRKNSGIKLRLGLVSFSCYKYNRWVHEKGKERKEKKEETVRFIEMVCLLGTGGNHTITERMTEGGGGDR